MRISILRLTALCAVALTTGALGAQRDAAGSLPAPFRGTVIDVPVSAAPGAAQPNLAIDPKGGVWLSWLEPMTGGHRFRIAPIGRDGRAGAPITVAEGPNFLANWADFPSLFFTTSGTLAAHWLENSTTRGTYRVKLRTSPDRGRTWTPAVSPHPEASPGEHGFVSFFEATDGSLGLVWLDGRHAGGHAPSAAGSHGAGATELRAATIVRGVPGPEQVVDPRVCDCCPTSAARTADGVVVAYRDRSDREIRDISVAKFSGGAWSAPVTVHRDNWEIHGCPVNGPAIAALGETVAVAWFTQVDGKIPTVRVAFSSDGGRTFAAPVQAHGDLPLGRVDLVLLDANRALLTSIERQPAGTALVAREIGRDGRLGEVARLAAVSPDRPTGFPKIVVDDGRAIFAWTEIGRTAPSRVRVAAAALR
jgi:hypothetical protein